MVSKFGDQHRYFDYCSVFHWFNLHPSFQNFRNDAWRPTNVFRPSDTNLANGFFLSIHFYCFIFSVLDDPSSYIKAGRMSRSHVNQSKNGTYPH